MKKNMSDPKLNRFGDQLAYYLSLKGWSQQYLADKLGTTQQAVSRWVNGISEPTLDEVLLISRFFGEDPSELMGYNDISADEFENFESRYKLR